MTYDLLTEAVTEYLHFSEAVEDKLHTGMSEGLKIWGACSNVVGHNLPPPLVEIGLTDL